MSIKRQLYDDDVGHGDHDGYNDDGAGVGMFLHRCRCTGSGCGKARPSKASFSARTTTLFVGLHRTYSALYIVHRTVYCSVTSQELRMLSSVTINCQLTKIVMNSGSQLSELLSVSQMSLVSRIVFRHGLGWDGMGLVNCPTR